MTDYGLTPQGFVTKPLQAILTDINQRVFNAPALGAQQDVSTDSPLGQINGIMSGEFALLWELIALVYSSQDPEYATNHALTVLASLTGTQRRGQSYGHVTLRLTIEAGETAPAGFRVSQDGTPPRPDIVFATDEAVTNDGVATADFDVLATCTRPGPISANAGTLTVIETAAAGVLAATNPEDAAPGRDIDPDPLLRQRRVDQLALRGGSTTRAIVADLLDSETHPELEGIETAWPLENTGEVADSNGLPPKSFEIVIDDGDPSSVENDAIAQAIFDSKPAGIRAFGSVNGTATDENGDAHNVSFSRRIGRDVYIIATLSTGPDFPVDGEAKVTAAWVERGRSLRIGGDVIALYIRAAAFNVPGVLDVPTFRIALDGAPGVDDTENLVIAPRERALFDTGRVDLP